MQSPIDESRRRTFEDPAVTSPEDRERLFGQSNHVRIYGLDYRDRLQDSGFMVKVDDHIKKIPDGLVKKYGLEEGKNIYYCVKPG